MNYEPKAPSLAGGGPSESSRGGGTRRDKIARSATCQTSAVQRASVLASARLAGGRICGQHLTLTCCNC